MHIKAIGVVHSPFKEKFGTPRQACLVPKASGYIEFSSHIDPYKCLQGLEAFSHVWILFWFHNNTNLVYRPLVNPPRLAARQRVGVLASRSPLRPNPIGLSLVKIEKVAPPRLYLAGLDVVEGTPVLDIKPYIAAYDSVADSKNGWLEQVAAQKMPVEFSQEAAVKLAAHPNQLLRQIISDILGGDIRNRNDKRAQREGKQLGFYYDDLNIIFTVNNGVVQVRDLLPQINIACS